MKCAGLEANYQWDQRPQSPGSGMVLHTRLQLCEPCSPLSCRSQHTLRQLYGSLDTTHSRGPAILYSSIITSVVAVEWGSK